MNFDVVALGELLIDFTSSGVSGQGNSLFEANPGGAPCNVLAMLSKLGKKTAFIGKVGNDMFGTLLKDTITDIGIDASNLIIDSKVNTTLAFVHTQPDGDRSFSFFRNPGADTCLEAEEINAELLQNCKIFHFGSLSLTHQPVQQATQKAVQIAKLSGALISFDPNLRPPLWHSMNEAKTQIEWGISQCDILKIADEELEFVTDCKNIISGAEILRRRYPNIKILFVTKGKHGAEAFYQDIHLKRETFTKLETIDTTGAGDTFCGSALSHVLEIGIGNFTAGAIEELLEFSNAAASLVTTKKGAIRSMPNRESILNLISG